MANTKDGERSGSFLRRVIRYCTRRVCQDSYDLAAGDFLVFPRGEAHEIMGSESRQAQPISLLTLFAQVGIEAWKPGMRYRTVRLSYGARGCVSVLLIGLFHFGEPRKNPLLAALPDALVVRGYQHSKTTLKGTIESIIAELDSDQPGSSMVIAKHADLLFVQALRDYLQTEAKDASGWIRGMGDPYVGKALAVMHAAPEQPWTIQLLAEKAGCSRAVLARRFSAILGEGALAYLTKWRMHIAAGLLMKGEANVSTVAFQIGYRPDAFANAFRRWSGVPPSIYRLQKGGVAGTHGEQSTDKTSS